MSDVHTQDQRRRNMQAIRGKHTKPELLVRSLLHRSGYRFRLHRKDLPGSPDLVFPSRRAVIFVHGCFWHRHSGCRFATLPATRVAFWNEKFDANVLRDRRQQMELVKAGWRFFVVWECEVNNLELLLPGLQKFLDQ